MDRRSRNSYHVRGVIDRDGYYHRGYDRYGWDYDRGYRGYDQRAEFKCTARSNGRVIDFKVYRYRY